jgi:MFS family permease
MPLAGRAADRFGLPGLMIGALIVFAVGSIVCGAADSLETLVVGRIIQGAGAGAILPVATAGASHLYEGHARSRALGFIGAATFLGMAIGPVLGALILEHLHLRDALASAGIWGGPLVELLTPAWRWVFYVTAPLAILAAIYVWAAEPGWNVEPGSSRLDGLGAALFSISLTGALLAITLIGDEPGELPVIPIATVIAVVTGVLAVRHMLRTPEPFLDLRLFANRVFSGAVLVSVLTGYALATAIVGMAAFIDRVRFAGPDEQVVVLGPMALFMAVGAFGSGLLMRRFDATAVTLAGLASAVVGLLWLSVTRIDTELWIPVASLSLFGLGFGLTVTPRSMAAVEAAGRAAFGAASAAVTVGRMAGMAIGMAVLTAFGTTRIDQTTLALEDQAFRDAILPPDLVGQPLGDPLVLDAIERWASAEAAEVLGQLFVVAAVILVITAVPAWLMREDGETRMETATEATERVDEAEEVRAGF